MRTMLRLWCVAAASVALGGCSALISFEEGVLPGQACAQADECRGEASCTGGVCVLPCAADTDCPESTACRQGVCAAAGAAPFGARCASASECSTALCEDQLCVSACTNDAGCPNGSACVAQICQPKLKAGFVFDAVVTNATSGFAHTHDEGREAAKAALPWLETVSSEGNNATTVNAGLERLLAEDVDVIFSTSGVFGTAAASKAAENPQTKFLTYTGRASANHVGYAARFHQAWFVAGIVAGTFDAAVTRTGRIGFVAPLPVPQVIRELNAFMRGVQSVAPNTVVEVVWANGFAPSAAVTGKLVDYLVTGGCRIIVNRLGTRTVTDYVDALPAMPRTYSIAVNDNDACARTPRSCLGAPYWNWGVLYTRLLQEIRRGDFDAAKVINESMRADPAASAFHFTLNDTGIPELASIAAQVATSVTKVVGPAGEDIALSGPYCVSRADQRTPSCVGAGERITDEELGTMCWLVQGIKQPSDPEDPSSPLVDAFAPDGTVFWPPQSVDPASIAKPSCR